MIDPKIAASVARRVAGDEAPPNSYLLQRLHRDLERSIERSEELVAEASGIAPPTPVRWGLIDRAGWAEANIDGMTQLLAPIAEKLGRGPEHRSLLDWPVAFAQRGIVSAELGVLLGYMSRRVLGQYDVLIPEDEAAVGTTPSSSGRRRRKARPALYFVAPNLVETERRFSFVPEDFALWVTVHEVTHRFQFAGVPWLRERFFGLINSYLTSMDFDARSFADRLARAGRRLATRSAPPEERNPVYLLASDEQRAILDEIQALMAVVEGHGNFVMDMVGARSIPSFSRMRSTFDKRREQSTLLQRALNHVIGLEMKLRQYELGQRFCESVYATGGSAALAALWSSPEGLPTLAELQKPDAWLRRVA
ncbi:MAG TPA: zinc-dependent metalloprotease [Actinomycetota bacterium]|nr:zinc-dependent metalloprotease [Actinomycetota bacterium]